MLIKQITDSDEKAILLWEQNLGEPWSDYQNARKFVLVGDDSDYIMGFAIYYDESDGVAGNFVSGWAERKNLKQVVFWLKYIANEFGEILIKTDKRQVKIICEKIGKKVKNTDRFWYYIIRGK